MKLSADAMRRRSGFGGTLPSEGPDQRGGFPHLARLERVTTTRSLLGRFPELVSELDRSLNDVDPGSISFGSNIRLWWRCAKDQDHLWCASVKSRTRGSGCPFCSGKKVDAASSLARVCPRIAGEWSPRNGDISPQDVLPGSARKVWWCCRRCGHEWPARVSARTAGSGCPMCASSTKTGLRLMSTRPDLVAEWSVEHNGPLDQTVTAGSERSVWWRCDDGHEWQARVAQRTRGQGCPYCSHKLASPETSLRAAYPQLALEWDVDRNGVRTPDDVLPGSGRRIWWRCQIADQHVWQAEVRARTRGSRCPFCTGSRIQPDQSIFATSPDLVAEWHWQRNGAIDIGGVSAGSRTVAWWLCPFGHEWTARVADRSAKHAGCPICAHTRPEPATSFAAIAPEIASEWHPVRNDALTPEQVMPSSNRKVWWHCVEGHDWQAAIAQRVVWRTGCPRCAESTRRGIPLAVARPDLLREWHPNLNTGPPDVAAGSHQKAWWLCPADPAHIWRAQISNRTRGNTGCPYCAHKRATSRNCLAAVAPWLIDEWHPTQNGQLSPSDLLPHSKMLIWWQCSDGHEWQSAPRTRVHGHGCPTCAWTRRPLGAAIP